MTSRATRVATLLAAALAVALAGCAISVPTDPDGTLDRVRGAELRVGAVERQGWVDTHDDGDPTGCEPQLVAAFAARLDAEVVYTVDSEQQLVQALDDGDLDLVIGGVTDDTAWAADAGTTRPYAESTDDRGRTERHVMLVPLGENAFLLELDRFLQSEAGR